jgi:hypothetical protein
MTSTPDLIKRLFAAGHNETLSTGALYLEAAEVLETKDMELGQLVLDKIQSEQELRAEIERLRALLKEFADSAASVNMKMEGSEPVFSPRRLRDAWVKALMEIAE